MILFLHLTLNWKIHAGSPHTVDMKLLNPRAVTKALVVALTYATAICLQWNIWKHLELFKEN